MPVFIFMSMNIHSKNTNFKYYIHSLKLFFSIKGIIYLYNMHDREINIYRNEAKTKFIFSYLKFHAACMGNLQLNIIFYLLNTVNF